MPKKFGSKQTSGDWPEITFINYRLSAEEKKVWNAWSEKNANTAVDELAIFMSNGHKTSISWDLNNSCWIASSTCKDDKSINHNKCIMSRSQDWLEAMMLNLFKASVVCKDGDWSDMKSDDTWG